MEIRKREKNYLTRPRNVQGQPQSPSSHVSHTAHTYIMRSYCYRVRLHNVVLAAVCLQTAVSATLLASQARDQGQVSFVYPKDVHSERDLSECPKHTACSVLYRRFWLPPLVERLCRCPPPGECGWSWTSAEENHTMALDNRAQLKFCTSLRTLSDCTPTQPALMLNANTLHHTTSRPVRSRTGTMKSHRVSDPHAVTALCYCSEPHHWEPTPDPNSTYRCTQLKTCVESEVCGFVRTDVYSTSYQCSCPIGQQCVTQDKRTHFHQLLLYSGPVYTALCTRISA